MSSINPLENKMINAAGDTPRRSQRLQERNTDNFSMPISGGAATRSSSRFRSQSASPEAAASATGPSAFAVIEEDPMDVDHPVPDVPADHIDAGLGSDVPNVQMASPERVADIYPAADLSHLGAASLSGLGAASLSGLGAASLSGIGTASLSGPGAASLPGLGAASLPCLGAANLSGPGAASLSGPAAASLSSPGVAGLSGPGAAGPFNQSVPDHSYPSVAGPSGLCTGRSFLTPYTPRFYKYCGSSSSEDPIEDVELLYDLIDADEYYDDPIDSDVLPNDPPEGAMLPNDPPEGVELSKYHVEVIELPNYTPEDKKAISEKQSSFKHHSPILYDMVKFGRRPSAENLDGTSSRTPQASATNSSTYEDLLVSRPSSLLLRIIMAFSTNMEFWNVVNNLCSISEQSEPIFIQTKELIKIFEMQTYIASDNDSIPRRYKLIEQLVTLLSQNKNMKHAMEVTSAKIEPKLSLSQVLPHCNFDIGDVGSNRYRCDFCHRRFGTLYVLKEHQENDCKVDPRFYCPLCKELFRRKILVVNHVKKSHPEMVADYAMLDKVTPIYEYGNINRQ